MPGSPFKKWLSSRRVVVLIVLLVLIVAVAVWLYLASKKSSGPPSIGSAILGQSKVEVKTEYKNPFDRKNQFVNPFKEVKNPFTSLQ